MQNPKNYRFSKQVPEGDTHERQVCTDCGWIHYVNPKIVVGAVITRGERILLCRRAIEPRLGFWTIPAGYMEERETSEAGAMREAQEEACADIRIDALLAVYNIPRISQVQLIYRATLASLEFSAGPESLEAKLFHWDEIPWDELAFPSVHWALQHHRSVIGRDNFPAFGNPPGEFGNY
jgi:ADP-ribose pyrophosphatase YjhB (NUDIX family)